MTAQKAGLLIFLRFPIGAVISARHSFPLTRSRNTAPRMPLPDVTMSHILTPDLREEKDEKNE
ncbi:hypothetical protein E2C01_049208 [Portunus trituberculatus]|uniref:Uncharacterized protein n=1 Tax=Portunus trituberculatus TaxID=210409 RepID=A0A5B7GCI5_PORTR|nr:hypothetical protein [Portunus trituberculatus]